MSNNLVFNDIASKLKVLANGMDGINTRPIKVDTDGKVIVTATDLDIRNLNATDDIVTVESITNTVTVKALSVTDLQTIEAVTLPGSILQEEVADIVDYSYYIKNIGNNSVTISIQVSPTNNDQHFVDDKNSATITLAPNEMEALIPGTYSNYSRIYYDTNGLDCSMEAYFVGRKA